MVHLVWIGGTGILQSIPSSLILKVYHTFAFKPITIKFGEFTNFWMLFQMTCSIFNSMDTEYSYQEKICSYPVPCSFRTWPIVVIWGSRTTKGKLKEFKHLRSPWNENRRIKESNTIWSFLVNTHLEYLFIFISYNLMAIKLSSTVDERRVDRKFLYLPEQFCHINMSNFIFGYD